MKEKKKKIKLDFRGEIVQDDLLIGSHGNTDVKVRGNIRLHARAITPAILADEATLHVSEGQLIFNPVTSGNARILTMTSTGTEECLI